MRKREEDSLKKDTATPISLLVLLWPHGLFQIPGDSVLYHSPHFHKSCLVPPLWQQYLPIPQCRGLVPLTPPHGQAPLSALYCQHCGISHLRPLTLPLVWTCRRQLGLPLARVELGVFPQYVPSPRGYSSVPALPARPATLDQITGGCVPRNGSHLPKCISYCSLK